MNYRILPLLLISLLLLSGLSLTGCDLGYWWSRGQPPASSTLLERANAKFASQLATSTRGDVKETITRIHNELLATNSLLAETQVGAKLTSQLEALCASFSLLEGDLIWGQRAAFGELSGQLAGFEKLAQNDQPISPDVFSLFSARTIFFLGEELANPAP
jgi:hypothetical protein